MGGLVDRVRLAAWMGAWVGGLVDWWVHGLVDVCVGWWVGWLVCGQGGQKSSASFEMSRIAETIVRQDGHSFHPGVAGEHV